MDDDQLWEYNAPQFVDFTEPPPQDDGADEYFNYDHENDIPVDFGEMFGMPKKTPKRQSTRRKPEVENGLDANDVYEDAVAQTPAPAKSEKSPNTPKVTPRRSARLGKSPQDTHEEKTPEGEVLEDKQSEKEKDEEPVSQNTNSKICMDLDAWRSRHTKAEQGKPGPTNKPTFVKPVPKSRSSSASSAKSVDKKPSGPPPQAKKRQRTISLDRPTRSSRQAHSRQNSSQSSLNASTRSLNTSSASTDDGQNTSLEPRGGLKRSTSFRSTAPSKPTLTMPIAPTFMKRKVASAISGGAKMTTEEMELERIKHFQEELGKRRKQSEQSLRKSKSSAGYIPARSVKPLTTVESFHFATDERVHEQPEDKTECKDFPSSLRSHASSPVGGKQNTSDTNTASKNSAPRLTQPQPFHLHESKKVASTEKFKSMAEQLSAFSTKTPERFRSKPKKDKSLDRKVKQVKSPKLTVPKTPQLETRGRKRPNNVVSQTEIEEQELEEIKKYKFHAQPVNEHIFQNPNCGVKKVPTRGLTKPVGFDLETDKRQKVWSANEEQNEEKYEFHAQPVPKAVLQGPPAIRPAPESALTIPESPAFALKHRLRPRKSSETEIKLEEERVVRANPVPHLGIPFQPKLDHRITEPQPFSFETRQQEMLKHKEETVQKYLEEEKKAREFHANPLPDLSPEVLPPKRVKPLTQIQPFSLTADVRGMSKADEWKQKQMEDELQQQRQQANFKANPLKMAEPFLPKKSTKPLTDVANFALNTDTRAEQRAEWEAYKAEREMELNVVQEAVKRQREEEEKQEVERLRKEAVHRANPVKHYKNVEVKPSEKPLTMPSTPRFSERLRTRHVDA